MIKIYKIIILLIFIYFPLSTNAHVNHYEDLNRIEFDIYRNNKHIGTHIFSFEKSEGEIMVKSEINFVIKKFGVELYKYFAEGVEIYKDGILIKFNSKTNQNGKSKYVNMILENNEYVVDGNTIALWHFNEGSGGILYDSSPFGFHGTIHGNREWIER